MKHFLVFLLSLVSVVAYAQPAPPTATFTSNSAFGSTCPGSLGNLSATGCDGGTYTWYVASGGGGLYAGNVGPNVYAFIGTSSGVYESYYVTCTDGSGTSEPSNVVGYTTGNVPPIPNLTASVNQQCQGGLVTLTASGCNTASGVDVIQWVMDGGTESNGQGDRCNYQSSCTRTLYVNQTYTFKASCSDGGANGCQSDNAEITVTMTPTPVAPVLSASPATVCAGSPATLSASGCEGTVTWSTGAVGASITVNPVALGTNTYTATCTVNGCVGPPGSVDVTVNATPPAPTMSGPTSAICPGGSATLNATECGGTVTWSNGATGASISVNPISTTNYTATCTENGCVSAAASVGVTIGTTPAVPSATVTQPTCFAPTGSAAVASAGASEFSLNGGGFGVFSTFSGLSAGTYSVVARSADGCTSGLGSFVVNAQPATLAAPTASVTHPTCELATGSVNAFSAGAAEYSLDGGAFLSSITFSGLSAGSHAIVARSGDGCVSGATSFVINAQPTTPETPTATVTHPTCTVVTGSVNVSASGASMYSLDGGAFQSSGTFNGLSAGTHSVVARSADGCISGATSFVINAQPATPSAPTASVTHPTCSNATGSVNVASADAAEYSLNGGAYQSSNTFTGLSAGTHSVVARSLEGCVSAATSFDVNLQPSMPIIPVATVTQPTCLMATGSAVVVAAGATEYSVNGGGFSTTTTYSGLPAGTYSILARSADGCVSDAGSFVVNVQPNSPDAPSANVTQPTCSVATGSVNVSSPGATAYSVDGGGFTVSTTFTGLAAGTHSVVARSADGCDSPATSFVVNPQPATPSAPITSVAQPTCTVATGSVNVSSSGATEYSVDGGMFQASGMFTGLSAGMHSVIARSGAGCVSDVTNFIINAQPVTPLAPTAMVTQPTCSVATGNVGVSPSGASTYSVDGGSFVSSTTFTGLAPGTHTIAARSSDGCDSPATSFVVNPQPLTPEAPTLSASPTAICAGGSTVLSAADCAGTITWSTGETGASILVTPNANATFTATCGENGCTSPAASVGVTVNAIPSAPAVSVNSQPTCLHTQGMVVISSPTEAGMAYFVNGIAQSGSSFPLSPGTYSITVQQNGCTSPASTITVNAPAGGPAAPTATVTTQPTCLVTTGTVTISAPTGADIEYLINGSSYQASTTFAGVAAGSSFNVIARFISTGCTSAGTPLSVSGIPSNPATPAVSITQPTCTEATATLTVTAPVGADLTYALNGGAAQSMTSFAGLVAGTYSLVARDNSTGCVSGAASVAVNVQPATPGTPTATVTHPMCSVATGSVTVSASGASEYSVDGGAYQVSATFSGLSSGTHSVVARSAAGCVSVSASFVINAQPTAPSAPVATVTQPSCSVATGSVNVSSSGAQEYSVDGGFYQSSGTFSGLSSGTHSVVARSEAGCVSSATSFVINAQPEAPALPTISVSSQPTCLVSVGAVSVDSPAGAGLTYYADDVLQSGSSFTLSIGLHSITVREKGCESAATTVTITPPAGGPADPALVVTATPTCDTPTGTISVTAPEGPSIEYSLDGGAFSSVTSYAGLAPGTTHSVIARFSATGCASGAASVMIPVIQAVATPTGIVSTQPNCTLATGTLSVSAPTGANYMYSIDGGSFGSLLTFAGLDTGTHTVRVKDISTGCVSSGLALTVNAQPATPAAPALAATPSGICVGSSTTLTATGCTGTIIWSTGMVGASLVVTPSASASYTATCTDNGCISSAVSVAVTVHPIPNAPVLSATSPVVNSGSATQLLASGCAGIVNWSSGQVGTPITVNPIVSTTYVATCTENGCLSVSASVAVTVDNCFGRPTSVSLVDTGLTRSNGSALEKEQRDANPCSPTFGNLNYAIVQPYGCASPTAVSDNTTTSFNTPVTVSVLGNDKGKDNSQATTSNVTVSVQTTTGGTAAVNSDGTLSFTPTAGFTGNATVPYTICDIENTTACSSVVVTITVQDACFGKPTSVSLVATGLIRCNGSALERELRDVNTCSSTFNGLTYEVIQPYGCASPTAVNDVTSTSFNTPVTVDLLTNDSGKDDTPASLTNVTVSVVNTTGGTTTVNPDGTVIFTPMVGFAGTATITYTICDVVNTTSCSTATVSVTIHDACFGKPTSVRFVDTGVTRCNGSALEKQHRDDNPCSPTFGTLQYVVVQPYGCASPTAVSDLTSTVFDTPVTVGILANDSGKDTTPAMTTNVTVSLHTITGGTASVNSDGTVYFIPTAGFSGTATINYTICDVVNTTVCSSAVATIVVREACFGQPTSASFVDNGNTRCNEPALEKDQQDRNPCSSTYLALRWVVVEPYGCASPMAVADVTTTSFNTPTTVFVLSNDKGKDDSPASLTNVAVSVLNTTGGATTVNPDGTVMFTPTAGFSGTATIIYRICDVVNTTACSTATVSVEVRDACFGQSLAASFGATGGTRCNGVVLEREERDNNTCSPTFGHLRYVVVDPTGCASPSAVADAVVTAFNTSVTVNLLVNDKDRSNNPATLMNVTPPVILSAPLNGSVSITNGVLTYTPTAGFVGIDGLTYQICDPQNGRCSSTSVSITVRDACFGKPTAASLVATGVTRCNGLALERELSDMNACSSTFNSLTYEVIQPYGCASPTAVTDAVMTSFNTLVTVSVLTNDKGKDNSPASLTNVMVSVVNTTGGTSMTNPDGTVRFTPADGFTGSATVVYQICDRIDPSICSSASIVVTVQDACFGKPTSVSLVDTGVTRCHGPALEKQQQDANPCSPTFGNLSYIMVQPFGCSSTTAVNDVTSTGFNHNVTVAILLNDRAKDGSAATTTSVTTSILATTNGTSVLNADGTVTVEPTPGFSGTATVSYQICDVATTTACSTALVTIVVRDACFGKPMSASFVETATTRCNGPALEVMLRDKNPCSATYLGTKWQVVQPYGCASPTAVLDNTSTAYNTSVTVPVLTNDRAKDGSAASLTNVTISVVTTTGGTSSLNPDGTISVIPTVGFTGTATVVYQICDLVDASTCSSTSVLIAVRDVCFGKPTSASLVDTGVMRCNGVALEKQQRDNNACSSTFGSLTFVVVNPTGCASPSATVDATTTPFNSPVVGFPILPNDTCGDGTPASLTNVNPPTILSVSSGTAVVNPDGTLSFTPTSGFTGTATVIYKFCEKTIPEPLALLGNCASTTVLITVLDPCFGLPTSASYVSTSETRCNGSARERAEKDVNTCSSTAGAIRWVVDDPYGCASVTALSDIASTSFNTPVSIAVLGNDRSKMNTPASLTNVTLPLVTATTRGTATIGLNGVMLFTPEVGYTGMATVVYRICDAVSSSAVSSSLVKSSISDSSTMATNCVSATVTIYIGESPCAPGQGRPLQVTRINLDCYKSEVCIETCGGDGTPIQFFGIGATEWSTQSCVMVGDDLVHYDPKVLMFRLVQGKQELTVPYDLVTASQGCSADSRPWNRPVPGSPAPPGVPVTVPGNPTGATDQPFVLLAPIYNCQTGAMSFRFSGGDGTPVEFMGVGITSWTNAQIVFIEAGIRIDRPTVTINARQSGVVRSVTVDLKAYCANQTAPVSSTSLSATVVTPVSPDPSQPGSPTVSVSVPVTTVAGGVFRLIEPFYNCQTGAFTFRSGGANGGTVEYMAVGITGWTTSVNHVLDAGLRNSIDLAPFTLRARVNALEVSYNWDLRYFCTQALAQPTPVTVTMPTSPTSTTTTIASATAATPVATTVSSTTMAPVASATVNQPVTTTVVAVTTAPAQTTVATSAPLRLVAPLYDCQTGVLTFRTEGGDGSRIEFMAIGVTGWTTDAKQNVDDALRTSSDVKPLLLKARQSGVEVSYSFDLLAFCQEKSAPVSSSALIGEPVSVTPIIVVPAIPLPEPIRVEPVVIYCQFPIDSSVSTLPVVKIPPVAPAPLGILSPFYNCQTGAFRFRSTGQEGTVEYMAVGVTGWSTQSGDYTVRPFADSKPFLLLARLVAAPSTVVSLEWNYRTVCGGSARIATTETPLEVILLGNPVSEPTVRFLVKGQAGESMRLETMNVSGALVDELNIENAPAEGHFTMQVSESAGVYLLRVRRGNEVQTVKIVKQ